MLHVSPSGTTETTPCLCEDNHTVSTTANSHPSEPCDYTSVTTEYSSGIAQEIIVWVHLCVYKCIHLCSLKRKTLKQYF